METNSAIFSQDQSSPASIDGKECCNNVADCNSKFSLFFPTSIKWPVYFITQSSLLSLVFFAFMGWSLSVVNFGIMFSFRIYQCVGPA